MTSTARPRTFTAPRAVAFLERLRKTMGDAMWSVDELAEAMHTHRQNLMGYLTHMREMEPRQAYVADYRRPKPRGPYAFLFRLGDMPDARHPNGRQIKGT